MNEPPFPPPPHLPYAYAGYEQPRRRPVLQFFGGLGMGLAFSALGWALVIRLAGSRYGVTQMFMFVPIVKLAAGITLVCLPNYRLLGAGILVSLALVILIAVSLCFGFIIFH